MEELKPCPFCGGKARDYMDPESENDYLWWVTCDHCAACSGIYQTRAKAVEAWNRRCKDEAD